MERGSNQECFYCGKKEKCTQDHFYPKTKNGKVKVWACRLCQFTKGSMMPTQFLSYMESHPVISEEAKKQYRTKIKALIKHLRENE